MTNRKNLVMFPIIFFLIIMIGLVFFADKLAPPTEDMEDMEDMPYIDRETIYAASATLMGFATFGSILGMRLSGSVAEVHRFVGAITMICGMVGVIFTQAQIMYRACCDVLSNDIMGLFIAGTAGTLTTIVVGFAIIVEGQIKYQNGSNRD